MKIAFRADAGSEEGMGHIVRSLTLARALPEEWDVNFIVKQDDMVADYLKDYILEEKIFFLSPNISQEDEIKKLVSIVTENNIRILVNDSYEIGKDYLEELKQQVDYLASIHDFAPFAFPSDIVINGNIYAPELDYSSTGEETKFLLGPRYLLLREEFCELAERKLQRNVERILVTVGGADPLNLTPKIIEALGLLEDNYLSFVDVVIGPAFDNVREIKVAAENIKFDINLHCDPHNMAELMLNCGLAVSAGGSTLYELAATGTPAVTVLQAENQIKAAGMMDKEGIVINLGMGHKVSPENIAREVSLLLENYERRKKMSERGQELVDGRGVERCVREIIKSYCL